jgi:hypothetical protein
MSQETGRGRGQRAGSDGVPRGRGKDGTRDMLDTNKKKEARWIACKRPERGRAMAVGAGREQGATAEHGEAGTGSGLGHRPLPCQCGAGAISLRGGGGFKASKQGGNTLKKEKIPRSGFRVLDTT